VLTPPAADRERGPIKKEDVMPIVAEHEFMWTLSADRKTVRLAFPARSFSAEQDIG